MEEAGGVDGCYLDPITGDYQKVEAQSCRDISTEVQRVIYDSRDTKEKQ